MENVKSQEIIVTLYSSNPGSGLFEHGESFRWTSLKFKKQGKELFYTFKTDNEDRESIPAFASQVYIPYRYNGEPAKDSYKLDGDNYKYHKPQAIRANRN